MSGNELKTICLVLRAADYRDSDKILTLFSKEHGRLTALARGAKKGKLKFVAQPMFTGEFLLTGKGDKLYVTQAQQLKSYFSVAGDFSKFASANIMLECTELFLTDEPSPKLFALIVNCLEKLKNGIDPAEILAYFMVKILCVSGYEPHMDSCINCGSTCLEYFSFELGSAVCKDCEVGGDIRLNKDMIALICKSKLCVPKSFDLSEFNQNTKEQVRDMMIKFIEHICERRLKSTKIFE